MCANASRVCVSDARRPLRVTLGPGTKITRSEYAELKGLGLDVAAPTAPPPAAAAAASPSLTSGGASGPA
jgi:hypothetical protein